MLQNLSQYIKILLYWSENPYKRSLNSIFGEDPHKVDTMHGMLAARTKCYYHVFISLIDSSSKVLDNDDNITWEENTDWQIPTGIHHCT